MLILTLKHYMHWIEKRNEKGGAEGKVGEYLPNKEEGEEEQQRWGWCHWGNKEQREREWVTWK